MANSARVGEVDTKGKTTRTRGVVFTPAELDYEGVDNVLDRMVSIGANAVSITPGVFLPGTAEEGVREPPIDVDGEVRELDRPLWGSRVAYVRRYSPYAPNPKLWEGVPFRAPAPAPDTYQHDVTRQMIVAARQRGIDPYIILSPTVLPGLPGGHSMSGGTSGGDSSERPLPIDGRRSSRIIAGQGCPNNPGVRALVLAQVHEAIDHYGDAEGFFFDWLEYTCYFLEDVFTCVCEFCQHEAIRQGLDWDALTGALRGFYDRLHRLTNRDLHDIMESGSAMSLLGDADANSLRDFWGFKAQSVANLLQVIAATMRASESPHLLLASNGFPSPWSTATGSQFDASAPYVDQVHPKFFTFHWSMMVKWYGETLRAWNPDLDEELLVKAILSAFDLQPAFDDRRLLMDFGMPTPTQPHPLSAGDIRRKVEQVTREVAGHAQVEAYVHGYQPVETFNELIGAMEDTPMDGVWVQRYGYLSDEKLEVLKSHWHDRQASSPSPGEGLTL